MSPSSTQTFLATHSSESAGLVIKRSRVWVPAGKFILCSRVNLLCRLLFQYPFHPRVTAAARKRPRPFCRKRRWQVTAKHACTLRMWLRLKWCDTMHGGMVDTERAETAAVSRGASRVTTKQRCISTPLGWILKKRAKNNNHSLKIKCDKSAVSLLESRVQHCIKATNNNNNHTHTHTHTHTRDSLSVLFLLQTVGSQ